MDKETIIKWVKFYTTGSKNFVTFFVGENRIQTDEETIFENSVEAVEKSTVEVFIFWDEKAIGPGTQTE